MQVIILTDPQAVADRATKFIVRQIKKNSSTVMGLATGSTPLLLYQRLIEHYRLNELSFSQVTTFNLDEYVGINPDHPQSYHRYMNDHFFKHIDIAPSRTHIPKGNHVNPVLEAEEYEKRITAAGGIDLQILGIGRNGHIGFNEPSSSLSSITRIKTLTQETIADNSRFFSQEEFQPVQAITMGMNTIMNARMIILLATGKNKSRAIAQAVEGPVSASCPASVLQFHRHTVFLIDQEAAGDLQNQSYYYHVDELTEKTEKLYRMSDI